MDWNVLIHDFDHRHQGGEIVSEFLVRRRTFLTGASAAMALGPLAVSPFARFSSAAYADIDEGPSIDDFRRQIGTEFSVARDGGKRIRMTLREVNPSKFQPGPVGRRRPFSLIFRVMGTDRLSQDVYRVMHPGLGSIDQLLVPVFSRTGQCVESVFA